MRGHLRWLARAELRRVLAFMEETRTTERELRQPQPLLRKTGAAEVIALGNVARLGRLKLFAPVDLRQTSSVRSVTQALSDHI